MAGADGDTPGAAAERTRLYAQRVSDLTPVMQRMAVEFSQQTAAAFRSSRSPYGEDFPRLAPSTVARRAAKLRGANRRSKKTGRLTKAAQTKRRVAAAVYAHQAFDTHAERIFTPLIDSGRMRQSIAYVPTRDSIQVSGVFYLRFHVTGSLKVKNRPPKRNPLVIQQTASGGGYALIPKAHSRFLQAISSYVRTGMIALGTAA